MLPSIAEILHAYSTRGNGSVLVICWKAAGKDSPKVIPSSNRRLTLMREAVVRRQNQARAQEKEMYSRAAESRAQAPPSAAAAKQAPVRPSCCQSQRLWSMGGSG